MASTASNNFYRNPQITTIAYAVGILLFFLPFLEIKCNGSSVAQLSGKDMVFGSSPELGKDLESFGKNLGDANNEIKTTAKTESKGKVYVAAIVALALGILGLIFSLRKPRPNYAASMLTGAIGALALIVLIIQVKGDINSEMKTQSGTSDPFSSQLSGMMKVSVDITFWFILCVLSYLLAAFVSYKQKQLVNIGEIPSANAPQTPIQNPGDQSEFPAAPTGDKDLG